MDSTPSDAAAIGAGAITRNTLWNFAGRGLPLAVALLAIPLQVKGFGTERFGLLALFWAVAGYFGLFDMGIGRATTKMLAERLAAKDHQSVPGLIWTSWRAMAGLGIVAGLVLAATGPFLVADLLSVPEHLQNEATRGMYWLALMLPFLVTQAGLQGVLEARQRFDMVNVIQIPAAILAHAIPLLVLLYTDDIGVVMAALLAGRLLAWTAFLGCCVRVIPGLARSHRVSGEQLGRLLRFGGWHTVSNVVGPLMIYADRFLIGSLVNVSAVAYYATPYSIVTQLWIIPNSVLSVLFPIFSSGAAAADPALPKLYWRTVTSVFLTMVPLSVGLMVLSHDLMTLWLGAEFARHSAPVLSLLALGVLVNSLAQVPYSVIQASGKPDVTAKFHLLELVPYFALLWWCTDRYGIVGAAAAWVVRVGIDAALLFVFAGRLMPASGNRPMFVLRFFIATVALYGAMSAAAGAMPAPLSRAAAVAVVTLLAAAAAWKYWLTSDEKALLTRLRTRC